MDTKYQRNVKCKKFTIEQLHGACKRVYMIYKPTSYEHFAWAIESHYKVKCTPNDIREVFNYIAHKECDIYKDLLI